MACHLNWYAPYTAALELIRRGDIGPLGPLSATPMTPIGSHSLALIRLFAGAQARWVFGHMDDDAAAASDADLSGSGYVCYEAG